MIKTFTPNDVLRFYYNEVTENEKIEIQEALLKDETLSDFYCGLIEAEVSLDKIKKEPSDKCIEAILNYSKCYSVQSV